jgi:hypothetical protein
MVKTAVMVTAGTLALAAALPARAQVGGSGTTGFVPRWVGSTQLGNSNIFSSGALTGIGTKKPGAKLEVVTGNAQPALLAFGGAAPGGSDQNGSDGIRGSGGAADPDSGFAHGGSGVVGIGGASSQLFSSAGAGGAFFGGSDSGTGSSGDGIFATCKTHCLAGNFAGDVNVTGTLTAAVKKFRIDDPIDPANKYLVHAAVESSEMKNIYDGTVVLDAHGTAIVALPAWFEAENGDFRYQLTAIGAPCPRLYIARKIAGNAFSIAGGTPGAEVSWQVTGVRRDPFARAHPLVVEQAKDARERAAYHRPELDGAAASRLSALAREPALPGAAAR